MPTLPVKLAYIIQARNKTWIASAVLIMGGKGRHAIRPKDLGHVDNHRRATRFSKREVADYICDAINELAPGHRVKILPNPGSSDRLAII